MCKLLLVIICRPKYVYLVQLLTYSASTTGVTLKVTSFNNTVSCVAYAQVCEISSVNLIVLLHKSFSTALFAYCGLPGPAFPSHVA